MVVEGPEVLLPGSDFFMAGVGRLLLLIGAVALVIGLVVRVVRRRRHPERRRPPIVVGALAAVTVLGLVLTVLTWPPRFFVPEFPPLPQLLPDESLFYRPVTDLPAAPDSERWIRSQAAQPIEAGFAGEVVDGVAWGVPFNVVDDATPLIDVEITQYPEGSYPGPYPISDPAYIESMPTYHFDQHYNAVDPTRRQVWELFMLARWFGRWQAGSGATWSMDSLDYPDGSTIVSQLPLLPGSVTYAEVAAGRVGHAILATSPITAAGQFVWPARNTDGVSTDPDAPPMGAWLRLKPGVDLSGLGPQAQIVARAAQEYGLILSDTSPVFALRGTPDARWDDVDLRSLRQLTTDDFEFVDTTAVMVSPDSLAANPPG
jgi:hypothetical protein